MATRSSNWVGSGRGRSPEVDAEKDEDDLFAELDDDFDLAGIRERRLEELKAEMTRKQAMRESDHGRYVEVKLEKDLIHTTAKAKLAVVHFFHVDFRRCKIMDKHLETIASRHFGTRFIRADVANVPFLVQKLEIQVLPCVFCFVNGMVKDRIVGFEGIGETDTDNFSTSALELRLQQCGVIAAPTKGERDGPPPSIFGATASRGDEDDWDG